MTRPRSNAITSMPSSAMAASTLPPMYMDMLNLFSNTNIEGLTLLEKAQKAVDGLGKTNSLADSISQAKSGDDWVVTKTKDKAQAALEGSKSYKYVQKIINAIKEKLTEFFMRHGGALLDHVKNQILAMVPKILSNILGQIAPIYSDIKKAATAIYPALQKTVLYYKTRELSSVSAYPVAGDVIERVRAEIKSVAIEKGAIAITSVGSLFIDLASIGISSTVTTIVKAGIAVFNFLKGLYDRYVMKKNFKAFKKECINLKLKAHTLNATLFKEWLRDKMSTIPILASYIVCMPCYSSPFNFLDLVNAKPTPPSKTTRLYNRIKKKLGFGNNLDPVTAYQTDLISSYRSMQAEAKTFISECSIQLSSDKPGAMQFLKAARGERNFIPGTDEKAFDKAVRKQKMQNLLDGTTLKNKVKETFTPSNIRATA